MAGCFWKALLVVGALAIGGGSSLPHKPLTFEEAVDLAVSTYNNRSGEDSLYRLLKPVSPPDWDPLSESKQELNFTLRETVCHVAQEPQQCDFREDGVVKECRGYYFFGESPPVLVLTCESVDEEEEEKDEKEDEKDEKEDEKDDEDDDDDDDEEEEEEEKEGDKKSQPRRVKRFKKFWRKTKKSVKKRAKKFFKKPTVIGVSIPF